MDPIAFALTTLPSATRTFTRLWLVYGIVIASALFVHVTVAPESKIQLIDKDWDLGVGELNIPRTRCYDASLLFLGLGRG